MLQQNQSLEPIYVNLSQEQEPIQMESFCVNCEQQGMTTIMFSRIPYFKEIIIQAFYCDHCAYRNSEIQFGGKIADQAVKMTLNVTSSQDLNRQCIKGEFALIKIPEIEFEIPANKKGAINTIEGFIQNTIKDLESDQPVRKALDPNVATKIDQFIEKLKGLIENPKFTFILDDLAGNSHIQNPNAPLADSQLKVHHYFRKVEDLINMGFSPDNAIEQEKQIQELKAKTSDNKISAHKLDFNKPMDLNTDNMNEECLKFETNCHSCGLSGFTQMCKTSIPYFKELLIMSFVCEFCGVHSTETKTTGEITKQGKQMILHFKSPQDLGRDLFKSDTAMIRIDELDLELNYGSLGGVYTTVEGLVKQIHDHLRDTNPFTGDSTEKANTSKINEILSNLLLYTEGNTPFTLIIRDLIDNSFIQNPNYPNPDKSVEVTMFDRDEDEEDFLGTSEMRTENY